MVGYWTLPPAVPRPGRSVPPMHLAQNDMIAGCILIAILLPLSDLYLLEGGQGI